MKVVQMVGLNTPWWCQVLQGHRLPVPEDSRPCQVFLQASCSWQTEGLFDKSFSGSLHTQTLRRFPCLESFSVAPHVRHIEWPPQLGSHSVDQCIKALKEAPWVQSYSEVQCIRCLMGQPLYCSAANPGMWGERLYSYASTRYT